MSAIDLLAGLVLEDGRAWGEAAYPWQWDDARAFLEGPRRRCYFTRPRGASKTGDAAGVMIADLIEDAPPQSRSYAVAVDRDQGRLLVDSIVGFVERTEGLAGALRLDKWAVTSPKRCLVRDPCCRCARGMGQTAAPTDRRRIRALADDRAVPNLVDRAVLRARQGSWLPAGDPHVGRRRPARAKLDGERAASENHLRRQNFERITLPVSFAAEVYFRRSHTAKRRVLTMETLCRLS